MAKTLKSALERVLKPDERIARSSQHGDLSALQEIQRQRRHERSGQEIRREHGEDHRLGQRHEEVTGDAAQKEHRQEHDADAQRRHEGGNGDLRRAVEDRLLDLLALIQIPVDVLDLHGGVVHQHAHRERQPAKRHDVDGFSQDSSGR